jgi:HEAT repeat protein
VQRNALRRLAKYRPDPDAKDEQARAARAIEPMLKDIFVRTEAYAAMEVWATKDSVPALIAALDEGGAPPGAAVRVLTRLKDESAIEPLAAHYVKRGNVNELAKTLSAFGPPAEATALKLLDERNPLVRRAGLSILEEVGGKNALDVLTNPKITAALRKADLGAGPLITSAVAKIKARMK